jgi:hypothetical protein
MSEVIGQKGVYSFLDSVYESQEVIPSVMMANFINKAGMSDDALSDLVLSGLIVESPDGFYISSFGKKATLLLRAINGKEELSEIFRKLTYLYPQLKPYELLTSNITNFFIDSLSYRTDFIRIYICSPWIRLEQEQLEKVRQAIFKATSRYQSIQIFVITLPTNRYRDKKAIETLKKLRQLGAEIMTHEKLHAKLYISEPGPYGGIHYAIFGSENLTGRKNIELGIKIENDNELLRNLTNFFREIQEESKILKEV